MSFEQMHARREALPMLGALLVVTLGAPPHAQDSRDEPDGQNDYDGDQGEREEDAECFHDDVRRAWLGGRRPV